MFKPIFALVVGTTLFSAFFSVEPMPVEVKEMQVIQPNRTATVIFSDGSLHQIEMSRPMFMSNTCKRSVNEAQVGEMWLGKDGRSYVYEGNGVWAPRRKDQEPPQPQPTVVAEDDTDVSDQILAPDPVNNTNILDNVVIEQYVGGGVISNQPTCATCQYQQAYSTYTYQPRAVFRARTPLFLRLNRFFSRFRFRRW